MIWTGENQKIYLQTKPYYKYVLQTRSIQKLLLSMKVPTEERQSERVQKVINTNQEKYAIDETEHG